MAQGAFFSNLYAKRYAKQPIADQESYEKKLGLTLQYLESTDEVLEIGCGTGSTALLHAPYVSHIEGLDYAKEMVKIANNKASDQGILNATFKQGDVYNLDKLDKQYDVVLAMNILHLLNDQNTVIKNIHNLLKPDGYFISSTVCQLEMPWYVNNLVKLFSGVHLLPPINVLSDQTLKTKLNDAGFSIVEEWIHGKKIKAIFLVVRK